MDYSQRVRLITASLNDFLRLYKRPEHLDQEASLAEMREMAEEINLLIPSTSGQGGLEDQVKHALRSIRQTYKGRSWPTVSHIVDAMNASAKAARARPVADLVAPASGSDSMQIMASRINAGEAVGDEWIYGRNAVALIASGLVSSGTLRAYRSALYFAAKDVWGEDLAKGREADWLQKHEDAEALGA